MIYLLTAIGLTHGGSSTVHIYTQTIHRTTQLTTLIELTTSVGFTNLVNSVLIESCTFLSGVRCKIFNKNWLEFLVETAVFLLPDI